MSRLSGCISLTVSRATSAACMAARHISRHRQSVAGQIQEPCTSSVEPKESKKELSYSSSSFDIIHIVRAYHGSFQGAWCKLQQAKVCRVCHSSIVAVNPGPVARAFSKTSRDVLSVLSCHFVYIKADNVGIRSGLGEIRLNDAAGP